LLLERSRGGGGAYVDAFAELYSAAVVFQKMLVGDSKNIIRILLNMYNLILLV